MNSCVSEKERVTRVGPLPAVTALHGVRSRDRRERLLPIAERGKKPVAVALGVLFAVRVRIEWSLLLGMRVQVSS